MNDQTFLEILADSLTAPTVSLHDFLLQVNPREKTIHSFFEGKTDESFYGTFIRRIKKTGCKLKTYICGNKDSVYFQFDKLAGRRLRNQQLLFFVDKDLEDIIPNERTCDDSIYTTDYYSIENYMVNKVMLEQIWAEIFRQSSGHEPYDLLCDKFSKALLDFHEFMVIVMSWILYHGRNHQYDRKGKLKLDCVKLKKIYKIDRELNFSLNVSVDEIVKILDEQTKNKTYSFIWNGYKESLADELKQYDRKCFVRGHFELEFFVYFISSLRITVEASTGKPIKTPIDINDGNAVDILGPRVTLPPSLEAFLNMWLQPQLTLEA